MILLFIISAYDVLINKRQIAFFSSFPSVALKAQEHLATSVYLVDNLHHFYTTDTFAARATFRWEVVGWSPKALTISFPFSSEIL